MMLRMTGAAFAALLAMAGPTAVGGAPADNISAEPAVSAPPPSISHTTFDIVVNRFGNKLRGSEGTEAFLASTGVIIAQFPVVVTNCIYVATLGRATTDGGVDERPGFITVVRSSGFDHGVFVSTYGMGAKPRTRPFHLLVSC